MQNIAWLFIYTLQLKKKGKAMKKSKKEARIWLNNLTKTKFNVVVEELKLTPEQKEIMRLKFLNGFDNMRISIEMNKCVDCISMQLRNIYERVYENFIKKM